MLMLIKKNCFMLNKFILVLITVFGICENGFAQKSKKTSGKGCFTRQELTARSTGILKNIKVSEGDKVKPGEIIIELDSRLYQAGYKEAQAALLAAQATEKLAQDVANRFDKLSRGDGVTEQQIVESKIKLSQAKAGKMQAEAVVERLKAQLDDTTIKAEVVGVVHGLPTVLGMMVQIGQSLGSITIENSKCGTGE